MSTIDSYLKALLALSGNSQLAGARHALLQTLNDEDFVALVKNIMVCEFARGGLEDIASVVLDVIAGYSGDTVSPTTPYSPSADSPSASQAATCVAQPQIGPTIPVVAASLRCQTEQIIADMTVPPIQCLSLEQGPRRLHRLLIWLVRKSRGFVFGKQI